MVRYSFTVFLSAFLLFQVQPMIGKYILPWFGGGPAVWTTCMLFFQMLLLGGYLYAHLLSSMLTPRRQAIAQVALLLVTLALLPIAPSTAWKPVADGSPITRILLLLLVTVGGPYFLLSSTGPLMQRWFSWSFLGRSPYRLYALSNAGSLLALISYPFVVEPAIRLYDQVVIWSVAYAVYGVGVMWCALRIIQAKPPTDVAPEMIQPKIETASVSTRPGAGRMLLWAGLAACGSASLLATTNQLCMDVAPVPLLWVAPLCVYLLTFIITFDSPRWYDRRVFGTLLVASAVAGCWLVQQTLDVPVPAQVAVYLTVMFACCMGCHGELVRSRPDPQHLTLFYLLISAGGAIGGLFTAVGAPLWFTGFWEYHVALAGCCLLTCVAWCWDRAWIRIPWLSKAAEPASPNPHSRKKKRQAKKDKGSEVDSAGGLTFWIGIAVSAAQCWAAVSFVYVRHPDEFLPLEYTALLGVFGLIQLLGWVWSAARSNRPRSLAWAWINVGAVQLLWMIAFIYWRHAGLLGTSDGLWLTLGILGPSVAGVVVMALASRFLGQRVGVAVMIIGLQLAVLGGIGTLVYVEEVTKAEAGGCFGIYLALNSAGFLLARFFGRGYVSGGVWFWSPAATLLISLSVYLYGLVQEEGQDVLLASRNFYGVLRVSLEEDTLFGEEYSLSHGQIEHGFQYTDESMRYEPTSYYGYDSGIGMAIRLHPRRLATENMSVGVVGLGVGTLASYGERGDRFCFYEINQKVRDLSDRYFTYLNDSPAEKEVLMGDARIVMERELEQDRSRAFDVLAIDAFSGDSIPVHLLTAECADVYRRHLKPDGILAIHISNRYLDLNPVCRALSEHLGWQAIRIDTDDDDDSGCYGATWVLISANSEFLELPSVDDSHWPWDDDEPAPLLWTDDFASLWQVIQ